MTKIAFTSCFDALEDPQQRVWLSVREQHPDVLLLLGDSMYMDFGLFNLGKPRKWKPKRFANEMYRRYLAQSKVAAFRELLQSVDRIGATWDDHDFAWNNSCSIGKGKQVVPVDKRRIARGLFIQFRDWLRERPLIDNYPPQPALEQLLAGPETGIEEVFDVPSVRVVMLDGRTYREKQNPEPTSSMLGTRQRAWVAENVGDAAGLCVVCSGSVLSRSKESWDNYSDFAWLADQRFSKTVILSGDIHKNAFQRHKSIDNLVEATASGAARPGLGGDSGNFGLLDVHGDTVALSLFDEDGLEIQKTVTF